MNNKTGEPYMNKFVDDPPAPGVKYDKVHLSWSGYSQISRTVGEIRGQARKNLT